MARRPHMPGLLLRNNIWHIDKWLFGRRIVGSTYSSNLAEAEELLMLRIAEARRLHLFGETRAHTFRDAVAKYLAENQHKRSLDRDRRTLAMVDPYIGELPLAKIHQGTLATFTELRLSHGTSPGTLNRDLAVIRRVLVLAARLWRDEADKPWLPVVPLIPMLRHPDRREPYPLSVAEQNLLFSELDAHLASMALFKVNTGLREREVTQLRWRWEVSVPELNASIFVIPRTYVKNGLDRYVVLNRIARAVISTCRGQHPEFVFTYRGRPVGHLYNTGWRRARERAAQRYEAELGRACPEGFRRIRVHDAKHTYGFRLRVAGVSFEDRQLLLGHKAGHVTTHYSAPEIGALIAAAEKVCSLQSRSGRALAVVRPRDERHTRRRRSRRWLRTRRTSCARNCLKRRTPGPYSP